MKVALWLKPETSYCDWFARTKKLRLAQKEARVDQLPSINILFGWWSQLDFILFDLFEGRDGLTRDKVCTNIRIKMI